MKKQLYKIRLKLKFVSYTLLGLLTLTIILGIALLNERLIETTLTIIAFFIFRGLYTKQYHSKSLFLCSGISIIIFALVSLLEVKINISILYSVVFAFIITTSSYLIKDYLDYKSIKTKRKALENLTLEEMYDLMPNIKKDTIEIVYGYLHKSKLLNAYGYARSQNISESLVYKYLKQVRNEYKSLDF